MKFTKAIALVSVGALALSAFAQAAGGGNGGGRNRGGGNGARRMQRQGMMGMFGGGSPAMLLLGGGGGFGGRGGGGGAAGGGGGVARGGNMREDVESDLKLNDEQKGKLGTLRDTQQQKMREMMQSFFQNGGGGGAGGGGGRFQLSDDQRKQMEAMSNEASKSVAAILTPEQNTRLRQIWIQTSGIRVLQNEDVAKEVGLNDDQKAKVKDLFTKQQEANQALMQKVFSGEIDRSEVGERMQNNNKILEDEVNKVLNDAQKAKLKELGGAPFKRSDA